MAVRNSPWSLKVYNWDDKTSDKTPTPVSRFSNISIAKKTNAPHEFSFTCNLTDYVLANIRRGHYFELSRARTGTKTLWENGYIVNIAKSTANPMAYTISAVSPSWFLSEYRTAFNFAAGPGTNYSSVMDLLNGLGSQAFDHQGLLPPGWSANYVDGPGSTTGTSIGVGDIWKGGGETAMLDVESNLTHYGLLWREAAGHTNYAFNGQLDIGPLADPSGLAIWGGAPLLADMVANHAYDPARKRADIYSAATKFGYAVIIGAEYQADFQNIRNIIWCHGKNGHQFRNIAQGPPIDPDDDTTVINGWSLYTPAGPHHARVYYTKTNTQQATFDGQHFTFIATRCNTKDHHSDGWMYGIVDTTSVTAYGPCEYTLEEQSISDGRLLLSAGLGCVLQWSQPVESFVFRVAHPLTSSDGNPTRVEPGQTVDVHYSGQIEAVERDANGQWGASGTGTYTYLDYPGTSDTAAQARLKVCLQSVETWTGGTFTQELTLGMDRKRRATLHDKLAKHLMKRHHKGTHVHSFKKLSFDGIPFWFSNSPQAWESQKDHALYLNPGATVISDISHQHVFSDHHKWTFTIGGVGADQYVDAWFCKPVHNGTLLSPNPGGKVYGALRLAFTLSPGSGTNSAASSGFYTTTDGSAWVQRGHVHKHPLLDSSDRLTAGNGPVRVTVEWKGKHLSAFLHGADSDANDTSHLGSPFAEWADDSTTAAQILDPNNTGAIGWMLHGGSSVLKITDVHAGALTAPMTSTRAHDHPHNDGKHKWKNVVFTVSAWDGTHATVKAKLKRPATQWELVRDDGILLRNEWNGTNAADIIFTSTQTFTGGSIGDWLVYNGTKGTRGGVATRSWGWVAAPKWYKPSWNHVYKIGQLHESVDRHTGTIWLSGWGHGHLQVHGAHVAPKAIGREASHPALPHKNHLDNVKLYFATAGDPATFQWELKDHSKDGYLRADDGSILHTFDHTIGASASVASVPSRATIVYHYDVDGSGSSVTVTDQDGVSNSRTISANSFDWVYPSNDLTPEDADVNLIKIGTVTASVDRNTGFLGLSGWHGAGQVGQSHHTEDKALDAVHLTSKNSHGGSNTSLHYLLESDGSGGSRYVDPSTIPGVGGGVTSLNSETGALSITGGTDVSITTPSGSTVQVDKVGRLAKSATWLKLSTEGGLTQSGGATGPTVAATGGSGTTAISLDSNASDSFGTLTFTTGGSPTPQVVDVTFATAFPNGAVVMLAGQDANSANMVWSPIPIGAATDLTTGFTIYGGAGLVGSKVYRVGYHVVGW
jgi:hypothetical protein